MAYSASADLIQLTAEDYTWSTSGYIEGAAQTSNSKLGLEVGSIRKYANDLSSSSEITTPVSGITDAGSWDDDHVLTLSNYGIDKVDLSTGYSVASSSTSGLNLSAISKMFNYNGSECFAAIDSNDNTVKYFEWGSEIPIAIGPDVDSSYTGLELLVGDSVSDLNEISLLVSRNVQDGAKMDQYYGGNIVGSYNDGFASTITDMSYDAGTGILSTSFKDGRSTGGMANYDFGSQVIPEPCAATLITLAGLGALAFRRLYK